jgi:hypothetical protein
MSRQALKRDGGSEKKQLPLPKAVALWLFGGSVGMKRNVKRDRLTSVTRKGCSHRDATVDHFKIAGHTFSCGRRSMLKIDPSRLFNKINASSFARFAFGFAEGNHQSSFKSLNTNNLYQKGYHEWINHHLIDLKTP